MESWVVVLGKMVGPYKINLGSYPDLLAVSGLDPQGSPGDG